jgi:hypothetical protein
MKGFIDGAMPARPLNRPDSLKRTELEVDKCKHELEPKYVSLGLDRLMRRHTLKKLACSKCPYERAVNLKVE